MYRAIDLNCSLCRWERALDLAVKYKTHVDTVLMRRARHVAALRRPETEAKFLALASNVEINPEAIARKIAAELETERTRPGAKPFA